MMAFSKKKGGVMTDEKVEVLEAEVLPRAHCPH